MPETRIWLKVHVLACAGSKVPKTYLGTASLGITLLSITSLHLEVKHMTLLGGSPVSPMHYLGASLSPPQKHKCQGAVEIP